MAESVDARDRARKWYIDNPMATLKDVATEFDIKFETVRDWSKKEGWHSRRILKGGISDEQILLQASGMRDVIYEAIISGDVGASNISALVKSWLSLYSVKRPQDTNEEYDRDALLGEA